jgi:hypothetical protein
MNNNRFNKPGAWSSRRFCHSSSLVREFVSRLAFVLRSVSALDRRVEFALACVDCVDGFVWDKAATSSTLTFACCTFAVDILCCSCLVVSSKLSGLLSGLGVGTGCIWFTVIGLCCSIVCCCCFFCSFLARVRILAAPGGGAFSLICFCFSFNCSSVSKTVSGDMIDAVGSGTVYSRQKFNCKFKK